MTLAEAMKLTGVRQVTPPVQRWAFQRATLEDLADCAEAAQMREAYARIALG